MSLACISVPIRKKQIQMYTNRQTLDLTALVSWLCILCSATVYISTNIIPVLLQYYRLCLFGDVIIWTVCVNHKFKHSGTVIKSILYRNSWLPALLPSPSPSLLLQFMFGLDFFFFLNNTRLKEIKAARRGQFPKFTVSLIQQIITTIHTH